MNWLEKLLFLLAGALLLVVVSSLLLWENVASVPLSSNETDGYPLSINGLFHNAMRLTWNIKNLNMELRKTYVSTSLSSGLFHKRTSQSNCPVLHLQSSWKMHSSTKKIKASTIETWSKEKEDKFHEMAHIFEAINEPWDFLLVIFKFSYMFICGIKI